ncbi:Flp family type IVb pilin [Bacillus sp. FJAT-27245]|uniref:Flp family type IVb pilin n=1 Tax=Bacillus sp. FJAT-27245 TaxID=1684144 RepID=UPI0006A7724E|nr:Flp family type IVb pilin [Bacillus sp. FJAT-27245]
MNLVTRLVKEEEGQALTEYGLIVGLIAVACIAAVAAIGPELNRFFQKIKTELVKVTTT